MQENGNETRWIAQLLVHQRCLLRIVGWMAWKCSLRTRSWSTSSSSQTLILSLAGQVAAGDRAAQRLVVLALRVAVVREEGVVEFGELDGRHQLATLRCRCRSPSRSRPPGCSAQLDLTAVVGAPRRRRADAPERRRAAEAGSHARHQLPQPPALRPARAHKVRRRVLRELRHVLHRVRHQLVARSRPRR